MRCRHKISAILTAALAMLAAGPAAAAEEAAFTNRWEGAYVGIFAGGSFGRTDALVPANGLTFAHAPDGLTAGLYGGYNVSHGPFVYGIEADFGFSNASDTGDPIVTVDFYSNPLYSGHLRARLGYAAGNFLLYGAGGLAVMHYEAPGFLHTAANQLQDTDTLTGYSLGAGIEAALTPNLTARAEYIYDNYGTHTVNYLPGGFDHLHTVETHIVRAGLAVRFGGSGSQAMSGGDIAPVAGWDGFYAGLFGSHGWGSASVRIAGTTPTYFTNPVDGFGGGVLAGYNWQFGDVIAGLEADVGYADITGNNDPILLSNSVSTIGWNGHIRGRIGRTFGSMHVYAAAGLAIASFEGRVDSLVAPFPVFTDKDTLVGGSIGAGVEYKATDNLVLRAEYLYDYYGSTQIELGPNAFDQTHYDIDTHTVRAAAIWAFN